MIHITDNSRCCGCGACATKCPRHCIDMREDSEGFLYPSVDESACIDCGLCEKVCPELNSFGKIDPIEIVAARSRDEELCMKSSSGGIFSCIAQEILQQGGVVFGARFDENWQVVHDYTETIQGLSAFRGSKYVQSNVGNAYIEVERFLKAGRNVLFSGTPCQIAALHRFLNKDYERLTTVDFICHGVPSPGIWRQYLSESKHAYFQCAGMETGEISNVNFRDKTLGWHDFSLSIRYETIDGRTLTYRKTAHKDPFLKGFVHNLYLRPSCYRCVVKDLTSKSDVTLGDFWGVKKYLPEMTDDKGVSIVLLNTEKSLRFRSVFTLLGKLSFVDVKKISPTLSSSVPCPSNRAAFFNSWLTSGLSLTEKIEKYTVIPQIKRLRIFVGRMLRKIGFLK